MRGLKKKVRIKLKPKIVSSNSNFFLSADFCPPLAFPKTRRAIPRLGLSYERSISQALYKTLSEINKQRLGANALADIFPGTNHLLQNLTTNHLDTTNHRTNYLLVSANHLSSANHPPRYVHFCFCHNSWINYKISNEDFRRNASPDFVIFISLISTDYPGADYLLENLTQISNDQLPLATNHLLLSPHGNFLFKNLVAAIVLEAKLTYTEISHQKLKTLYLPLVEKALSGIFPSGIFPPSTKVSGVVICKNLTDFSPSPVLDSIFASLDFPFPLIQWLGHGKLNI